ncbi:MAG: MFS transporter [Pseudomonadota bacterium]
MDVPHTPADPPASLPASQTDPATRKDRRTAFAILMLATLCLGLGQTILFAILPPLARRLGVADIEVGLVFTLSAFFWVLMSPVWGRRSDQIGRKPVILLGVGVFAIALSALGLALHAGLNAWVPAGALVFLLAGIRAFHGLFSSAAPAASQAYIADRTGAQDRTAALAGLGAAFGIGSTLGPGIGGATVQFGPVVPLFAVSAIAAAAFVAIAVFLPEQSRPKQRTARGALKMTDARVRHVLIYGVVSGALMVIPIQLTGFYLLDVLALDETTASQYLGVVFMVNSLAALFGQLVIIGRFRPSPRLLLIIAPPVLMIGHLIIAVGNDFGTIAFGMLINGLGTGMIRPGYNAAISLQVSPEEQGAAAGLANAAWTTGHIFTPALAFSLYAIGIRTPFLVAAGLAVALMVFAVRFIRLSPAEGAD